MLSRLAASLSARSSVANAPACTKYARGSAFGAVAVFVGAVVNGGLADTESCARAGAGATGFLRAGAGSLLGAGDRTGPARLSFGTFCITTVGSAFKEATDEGACAGGVTSTASSGGSPQRGG